MNLALPHQLSKRDLFIMVASMSMVLLCVVLFDGYRSSQVDRIDQSNLPPSVILTSPDMTVFERLKELK